MLANAYYALIAASLCAGLVLLSDATGPLLRKACITVILITLITTGVMLALAAWHVAGGGATIMRLRGFPQPVSMGGSLFEIVLKLGMIVLAWLLLGFGIRECIRALLAPSAKQASMGNNAREMDDKNINKNN